MFEDGGDANTRIECDELRNGGGSGAGEGTKYFASMPQPHSKHEVQRYKAQSLTAQHSTVQCLPQPSKFRGCPELVADE